ncbi:MAG TPA: sigma factor [Gemmataceae bacterium]|jgi:RNA polymerase sigma-70 factor (ECF subfamily)|nr:sigma factor [Gemmataceae bacterium]
MDEATLNQHLSQIGTLWSKVLVAHSDNVKSATLAQALLLQRYSGAAYRYLLGAVRDPDVADDLAQEFALRFVRGDFRRADPDRGRFRDYLKTALIHLVTDYYRAQQAHPRPLSAAAPEPAALATDDPESETDFVASWRAELLERT